MNINYLLFLLLFFIIIILFSYIYLFLDFLLYMSTQIRFRAAGLQTCVFKQHVLGKTVKPGTFRTGDGGIAAGFPTEAKHTAHRRTAVKSLAVEFPQLIQFVDVAGWKCWKLLNYAPEPLPLQTVPPRTPLSRGLGVPASFMASSPGEGEEVLRLRTENRNLLIANQALTEMLARYVQATL